MKKYLMEIIQKSYIWIKISITKTYTCLKSHDLLLEALSLNEIAILYVNNINYYLLKYVKESFSRFRNCSFVEVNKNKKKFKHTVC